MIMGNKVLVTTLTKRMAEDLTEAIDEIRPEAYADASRQAVVDMIEDINGALGR